MLIVNFTHPLTPPQLDRIGELAGQPVDRVASVSVQFDHSVPFAEQVSRAVRSVGLSSDEWQTLPIILVLPSLSIIAAAVLAELHGRMGHFPTVCRLKPIAGANPPAFEVAEILNLQALRDAARETR